MAPNAKLAFDDISAGGESLHVPPDLNTDLFPHAYAVGARTHSLSWGSDAPVYDSEAMEIDQFMLDHPDLLVLVAAGNTGPGEYTVGTPATAKNSLAVGASEHSYAALLAYGKFTYLIVTIFAGNNRYESFAEPAAFGAPVVLGGKLWNGTVVQTIPADACRNVSTLRGKIALIERGGGCTLGSKVFRAQSAGAIAAIVADNVPGQSPFTMTAKEGDTVRIPAVMISYEDAAALRELLKSGPVTARLPDSVTHVDRDASNKMTDFSSQGPTLDSRIKPDVVCPGLYIHSAQSHGNGTFNRSRDCEAILEMSGTSMATPTCAGAAALVRQYFRLGFYPTGQQNSTNGFNATSALVKAMMIQAGQPLEEYDPTIQDFQYPLRLPDMTQGYGRVDLTRSLLFKGASTFDLTVWNLSVADGRYWEQCVQVSSALTPLKVTLVWTDPPGYPGAARVLVNDLDLVVVDTKGSIFHYGNSLVEADEYHNGHAVTDTTNNVEQVTVEQPRAGGGYTIRVEGSDVPLSPQPYALVVTGAFSLNAGACKATTLCPAGCSGHGTCKAGRCKCQPAFSGTDCSLHNPVLPCNFTADLQTTELGWGYTLLGLPAANWSWSLLFEWPSYQYPGFYVAWNRLPSEHDCDLCLNTLPAAFSNTTPYAYPPDPNISVWSFECGPDCVRNFTVLDGSATVSPAGGGGNGVWVLGVTAYTASDIDSNVTLQCQKPHPVNMNHLTTDLTTSAAITPMSTSTAATPQVHLQMTVPLTLAQFNATVQKAFRHAIASTAGVQDAQVTLSVRASSRRASPPRRRLSQAGGGGVVVDATVTGLASTTSALAVAGRLSADAINTQLRAAGLPAVQVTQAAQVVAAAAGGTSAPAPPPPTPTSKSSFTASGSAARARHGIMGALSLLAVAFAGAAGLFLAAP